MRKEGATNPSIETLIATLRNGVAAHRRLKAMLSEMKIPLVPLLLVQAEKSTDEIRARLLQMGFAEEQIAVHPSEEPDADLLALANDEPREVLVFKMAVALGCDAPRAFMMVSMWAARDADFGVQLVGRILRVHRRLQGGAQTNALPEALNYGYVFLADAETQTGLDLAGQRINAIQTEYANPSRRTRPATVPFRLRAPRARTATRCGRACRGVSRRRSSGQKTR
ncbi:MAG: hypothetical protein K8R23_17340 [Chthoniobacter sp.]|nr:hypothetical protein [Chthoniobacter sp.]